MTALSMSTPSSGRYNALHGKDSHSQGSHSQDSYSQKGDCTEGLGSRHDNRDLVWDLDQFKQRKRAEAFILQFENRICVYSHSVEQIYTNYNVFFPADEKRKLVILPSPDAHHDIFNYVSECAIKPTGLLIVPHLVDKTWRMMLRIPLRKGDDPYRLVPLKAGLKLINARRPPEQPLLPILMKGDLRELDESTPSLHLHSINLAKLSGLSAMEVMGIKRVILDKMQTL